MGRSRPAAPTISGSDPVGAALLLKKPAMLGCLLSGRCTLGCADALAAAAAPPVVTCTLMSTCAPAWAAARACKPGLLIAAERATPAAQAREAATPVHAAGKEHAVKTQRSLARSEVKATVENLANGVNKA